MSGSLITSTGQTSSFVSRLEASDDLGFHFYTELFVLCLFDMSHFSAGLAAKRVGKRCLNISPAKTCFVLN